jgi:acetylornithine deacetylase/succinyl-diaminopimelate desuccinylase-like protein
MLSDAGARPVAPGAGDEFHERTGARPAVDLNHVSAGAPRTVIPAETHAAITLRLAPGQSAADMEAVVERLLHEATPAGAELTLSHHSGDPSFFDPDGPVHKLAGEALARACGTAPVYVRSGGSIPVVADFAAAGYPTVVSGFSLPDDAFHAPDESFSLRSLELGEASARELYAAFASLKR